MTNKNYTLRERIRHVRKIVEKRTFKVVKTYPKIGEIWQTQFTSSIDEFKDDYVYHSRNEQFLVLDVDPERLGHKYETGHLFVLFSLRTQQKTCIHILNRDVARKNWGRVTAAQQERE